MSLECPRAVKPPFRIANLAYWVTNTEGSENPSLSAIQSGMFPYFLESVVLDRVRPGMGEAALCDELSARDHKRHSSCEGKRP